MQMSDDPVRVHESHVDKKVTVTGLPYYARHFEHYNFKRNLRYAPFETTAWVGLELYAPIV